MLIELPSSLWDQIGEGEVTNIAQYASEHYEKTGRPLRIAVDAACWIYNNVTKMQTALIRECKPLPSRVRILNYDC